MPVRYLAFGATVFLSACASDYAIVTGVDGNIVEVQTLQFGDSTSAKAKNEATRECAKRGFRKAEYISTRDDNYSYANKNFYACSN